MANLTERQKTFLTVSYVLGGTALLATLLIFLPVRASQEERVVELNSAKLESKKLEAEVSPLQGLPDKLVKTRGEISNFYQDRFPGRFSAVAEQIGSMAADNGVRLSDVKYETVEFDIPGLQEISMQASLRGDYASMVRFINKIERSKVFFLIDQLDLDKADAGAVQLRIKMKTYLRSDHRMSTAQDRAPTTGSATRKEDRS